MLARVFAPLRNTPGRNDVTGAFLPEAHRFVAVNALPGGVRIFDNGLPFAQRREQVEMAFDGASNVDVVAFFCHGWKTGIQAGYRMPNVPELALLLKKVASPHLTVLLYACDTARDGDAELGDDQVDGPGGEGGFADAMRDELSRLRVNARVYGHTTEGHCTQNPRVRVFDTSVAAMPGGRWLVEPGSAGWKQWATELRGSDRRFTFWREDHHA